MNTSTTSLCLMLRNLSEIYKRAGNDTLAVSVGNAADRLDRLEHDLEDAKDALTGLLEEVEQCIDCANTVRSNLRIQTARRILK
jgi:hypothetical protein